MDEIARVDRRGLLQMLGLGAGALVLGIGPARAQAKGSQFGAILGIGSDGAITIVCPSSEMGQGTQEALARLIAEELDCDWSKVTIRQPWADPAFINPAAKRQLTANSMTVTGYFLSLRQLGASARASLVEAAASKLGVPASELVAANSRVRHTATNRVLGYGELAEAAAALPLRADVAFKSASAYALIGKKMPRKDLEAKVTGRAEYGIDVHENGMLIAALALAPHRLAEFSATGIAEAKAMPGVKAVTKVNGGYAVIADSFWRARKAAEKVIVTASSSPIAGLDDAKIAAAITKAFDSVPAEPFPDVDITVSPQKFTPGDPDAVAKALAAAPLKLEAEYSVPYLAHAALEPLCCSARLKDGELLVRGPLQAPEASRDLAATRAGLAVDKVRVEITFIGGGFGRKWSTDFVEVAVQAALAVPGQMVKTIWTREQDFAQDEFRPAFVARTTTGLAADGSILAMDSRIAGESVNRFHKRKGPPRIGDPTAAAMLIYGAYDFPNKLIHYHPADLSIPVGFWRSVTLSQNAFFAESMIDEAARAAKRDSLAYRKAMLAKHPRALAVLDKVGVMIGWEAKRARGKGRGVALSYADNAWCAQAVEVSVKGKALTIERIACAFDCGLAIDPASVEAQISGGIVFGLQAALWGETHFADGAVTSANFSDYRMPILADVPRIDVALLQGSERPGSVGESSVPGIAPALANAIVDAGAPRVRRLPIASTLEIKEARA
ncbi:molybdopterin cofactor-binding domain-containing protein [Novosphingobium sp.]|uniref:xanthine dehydrogenase family protein molybdopterin-binding subunit n=1 Tax=Novosphingobium sp. TaxID=1874826 RepID=UPI00286E67C1|nr:molybdopterin cofactor-binding domain-containing protein [Novosphingobium sp.]